MLKYIQAKSKNLYKLKQGIYTSCDPDRGGGVDSLYKKVGKGKQNEEYNLYKLSNICIRIYTSYKKRYKLCYYYVGRGWG
jgi:hypothetical protein